MLYVAMKWRKEGSREFEVVRAKTSACSYLLKISFPHAAVESMILLVVGCWFPASSGTLACQPLNLYDK